MASRLTPILKPLSRWGEKPAVKRAKQRLEPYAQRRAAQPDRRRVIERLRDALNRHDLDALTDCFDVDYRSDQPFRPAASFVGRDQVRKSWHAMFAAVPDITADLLATAVADDTVWTEWRLYGTKRDGNRLDLRAVWIVGVRGERLEWGRLYREPVDTGDATIDELVERLMAPE